MQFRLLTKPAKKHALYLLSSPAQVATVDGLDDRERGFLAETLVGETTQASINQYSRTLYFYLLKPKPEEWKTSEALRKAGADIAAKLNSQKIDEVTINNLTEHPRAALLLAEGAALASYQFLKYRTEAAKQTYSLTSIAFAKGAATVKEIERLQASVDAVYKARDLVNEPVNFLTAEQLGREITAMGKEAGFKVRVMNKAAIEKEGMTGLLAVNLGSIDPPTFTIAEYKPEKALNKKPIVLVGKGIVFDTGGLSLKPTPASMDRMKSDMSGAAVVSAVMYAAARMNLPLHLIALVPATDNRPGENAYVPGDVIRMYSGGTVEVLNTDAEGRMVLADALHWAKRYKPELVMDFATLTGAASVAVGEHGAVCMGTADAATKLAFQESGFRQYERLVEYPLWDEYGEQIKSDVADIKNVGGPSGGAITAGKFLQHFTDYPWMHFDIAGVSFATSKKSYTPLGGTGFGIRMVIDFLQNYAFAPKA
jgi:leucyl aminopeptidase